MSPSSPLDPPAGRAAGARPRTALVLGGGGSVGNAWLIGVVAGLHDAGVDVTRADLVVGTSAGSTAAAQLTSADPSRLLADILEAPPHTAPAAGAVAHRPAPTGSVADHLERTSAIIAGSSDPVDMRRRIGFSALEMPATRDDEAQSRWRATVASRLPSEDWPPGRLLVTAVDASTGEPVVLDRDSGVDLVDAVAASCSSGFAYRIGGRSYVDGGYRTNADNADLAAGCERVLVLSPFGGRSRTPAEWGLHLATQVDELRAGGSQVEPVFPDAASLAAFGESMMDVSRRGASARAGYDQGMASIEAVRALWR